MADETIWTTKPTVLARGRRIGAARVLVCLVGEAPSDRRG